MKNVQTKPKNDLKFEDLFDHWLKEKSFRVRASTFSIYQNHVQARLYPVFKDIPTRSVTEEEIRRLCFEHLTFRADGKGLLSEKSRIDLLRTLNNILRFATEQGYMDEMIQVEYPKAKSKRMNVLREPEQMKLEKILWADIHRREALGVYLCLYTGIRLGELCGLKWDDICLDQGMIAIRRTVQRITRKDGVQKTAVVVGPPKSFTSEREIPIPEHILTILRDLKKDHRDHYFLSDTENCMEPRRMQRAFQYYLQKAEIPHRGFHCTRHTFATRWVELGIDVKSLSEILGHTSIRTTMDKYVHISEKTKRENINKVRPLAI